MEKINLLDKKEISGFQGLGGCEWLTPKGKHEGKEWKGMERNALYDIVMVEPVIIHLPKSTELHIYRTVQNEFYNMQILREIN